MIESIAAQLTFHVSAR